MLIEKPQCGFQNCRYCFDGNCRSADKYERCELTDLHYEIAKLTVDLDNAKSEVERLERILNSYALQYGTVTDRQKVIDKAKCEVAREIFEEIEMRVSPMLGLEDDKEYASILAADFAELKKKYTEGAE